MLPEAPKDPLLAALEALKEKPVYKANLHIQLYIDSEIPRLLTMHDKGNVEELVSELKEIRRKLANYLKQEGVPEEMFEKEDDDHLPVVDDTVLDSLGELEFVDVMANLEMQYQRRLATMKYFDLFEKDDVPHARNSIRGINNKSYDVPKFIDIQAKLAQDHNKIGLIRTFKKPRLVLTPIGMSLNTLSEKIESKDGRLIKIGTMSPQKPIKCLWGTDEENQFGLHYDSVLNLFYFPQKIKNENHSAVGKHTLIGTKGGLNFFPGWQVAVVEGTQEVEPLFSGNTTKDFDEFLDKWQEQGMTGLTPEEVLMMHAEAVLNSPFGDNNCFNAEHNEMHLGALLPLIDVSDTQRRDIPISKWAPHKRNLLLSYCSAHIIPPAFYARRAVRIC